LTDLFQFDCEYRSQYGSIAGIDEAGRGPLAGPLVAAGVVLPEGFDNDVLNDSKKLTDRRRRNLYCIIRENALHVSLGVVTSGEIDRNRMSWAVRASFNRVIADMGENAGVFLVDGNSVAGLDAPARFFVKGDSRSLSIAAASIIAKVTRDDMMIDYHTRWPQYGFDSHKGYGSASHMKVLREAGPCPIHRMSFEPLRSAYPSGQLDLFGAGDQIPGRGAETLAAKYLEEQGFNILHRNWLCPAGEIDLIAEKSGSIVFVEVKSTISGTTEDALSRIDSNKLIRIRKAAEVWLTNSTIIGDPSFLAVIVTSGGIETFPFS